MLEDYAKKMINVHRADGSNRVVEIVLDESTNKYCFINLTTHHVCACRFDTVAEAMEDLMQRPEVISFDVCTSEFGSTKRF